MQQSFSLWRSLIGNLEAKINLFKTDADHNVVYITWKLRSRASRKCNFYLQKFRLSKLTNGHILKLHCCREAPSESNETRVDVLESWKNAYLKYIIFISWNCDLTAIFCTTSKDTCFEPLWKLSNRTKNRFFHLNLFATPAKSQMNTASESATKMEACCKKYPRIRYFLWYRGRLRIY